jgi:hypothetical protein
MVIASPYTNYSDNRMLEKNLLPNEITGVFVQGVFTNNPDDIKFVIPDDYNLRINANGREHSINKAVFLQKIYKAEYKHEGDFHEWTVSDPSLCP